MKAVILEGVGKPLLYTDIETPAVQAGEVSIQLYAAAFNRRDYWIQQGQYAGLRFPSIQGSDGAGVVTSVGAGVTRWKVGDEVIINPSLNWGSNPHTQAKDYIILGMAKDGTFAEQICIDERLVYAKPTHISWHEAAALPLAGLTAYRALITRAAASRGARVLVTGVGGGVALFAAQFAIAIGCDVFITSGDDAKIQQAIQLGAKGGINYKTPDWHKLLIKEAGNFDVIIDSACGDNFPKLVDLAKPGGQIAFYGATLGAFNSGVPAKIFWKQISIHGSTMGSDAEFEAMLQLVNQYQIHPVVDSVFPLADAEEAIQKMAEGKQFGKIVLAIR